VRLASGGGWTTLATVPTAALQTSYTYSWTVTQSYRSDYKIYVQYIDSRGYWIASDASNGTFSITL
jgi:hypothetical protein